MDLFATYDERLTRDSVLAIHFIQPRSKALLGFGTSVRSLRSPKLATATQVRGLSQALLGGGSVAVLFTTVPVAHGCQRLLRVLSSMTSCGSL